MAQTFLIVVVHVHLWIMHVDPAANIHAQLLGMPLGFFEICVVPSFPIFEARSLCTCDAFESRAMSIHHKYVWGDLPQGRVYSCSKPNVVFAGKAQTCCNGRAVFHCLRGPIGRSR